MVKPKAPQDMQRPNRRLGDVVRALVGCPLCRLDPEGLELRVVAYRRRSIRLECRLCGLRFSVDEETLAQAIGREPSSFTNAMALTVYNRHEADP
jgi:transcription elongation factor Elf1